MGSYINIGLIAQETCIKNLLYFFDSEAHLGDEKYSIYVQYLDEPKFVFNNWKIDGLTERL